MLMKDGEPAIYDDGFYNIGVRITAEDISLSGIGPLIFHQPLGAC
jgi:hypothetical protein